MPRGRPRLYANNAERMKALRARRKAQQTAAQPPPANPTAGAPHPSSPAAAPGPNAPARRAHSEPYDEEDYVLSGVLWRGAEWASLRFPDLIPGADTPFRDLLARIMSLASEDKELGKFLETMPRQLNSIDLLTPFLSLFPGPHPSAIIPLPPGRRKQLTRREGEVLQELARNRSQIQAAARLEISPGTIRSHVHSLQKKLNASTTLEAIFKASAMGEAGLSLVDVIESLRDGYPFDYRPLSYSLHSWHHPRCGSPSEESRPLASFGLLLLLIANLDNYLGYFAYEQSLVHWPGRGAVLRYTPDGKLIGRWDTDGSIGCPRDLIFIPHRAEARGFRPGQVLVLDHLCMPNPINGARIVELTPEGHFVRSFAGGDSYLTGVGGVSGLAFARDGSLLVGSCSANAVLAFTEGGNRVRNFIREIPYGGVAVDSEGRVLVAGGWEKDNRLQIFSADGKRRPLECGNGAFGTYFCLAVHGATAYLGNYPDHRVEVYSTRGTSQERRLAPERTIELPNVRCPRSLAISSEDRLYVLDERDRDLCSTAIHAFQASTGRFLFTLEPPDGAQFRGLTVGPDNLLYATAQARPPAA